MGELTLCCLGVSHKTAPVSVREKFSFKGEELENALLRLNALPDVDECFILSTCNRVEIYFTTRSQTPFKGVIEFLVAHKGASVEEITKFFYRKSDQDAVRHGFYVASSLDSMIVGEPQIVGQFKDAFYTAKELGTVGTVLCRFCETALKVSKRVRTETGISRNAVSISFAAVELAKKIFGDLNGKKVAIIGAGEMAELAVKHLISNGASEVFVVNRTLEKAQKLAEEFGGKAFPLTELETVLKLADIVISSTGAPGYVLTPKNVLPALKARPDRPMFLIDIAVPRDIDPALNDHEGLYLYDIDDLQHVVEANIKERLREAEVAKEIIEGYVQRFIKWLRELEVAPLIAELKEKAEAIRKEVLEKRLPKLGLTPEQEAEVDNITRIIINKLLHQPITNVKKKAVEESTSQVVQIFREIFGLSKE
ncbi:glutamyl-tRNA reductase [Thermovibrio ammonificans HB-1]|uniref:Glutamyl-tRNA reductase n=1 Tax=Thermovibrio ammonificans (strain DSM 15698 / JCM 12110 / HB-1) TaxID=648996 RepID=E8T5K4_THEA1|nr:glutamyl-tRNA reductase [Thermovibrio ammonificans]ADU96479.1 glutamyl-tRNA reductase [Thermovibrio ammonificans HB-1]